MIDNSRDSEVKVRLEELKAFLSETRNITITSHQNPDADALGSSLAMYNYLKDKGHHVTVISPNEYPDFLEWMPGIEEVLIYENGGEKKAKELIEQSDLLFCLDFSGLGRVNKMEDLLRTSDVTKVMIDHHLHPEDFASYKFWNNRAAATAELIYYLIAEDFNDKQSITIPIAECIYAGILTDTGSFRHPTTTSRIHRIIANLIDIGVNASRVHKLIYDNNSVNRLKVLGYLLYNKMKVMEDYHTCYITISKEEMERFDTSMGDTEGIVNYALSIKGITLAAIFIQKEHFTKISFRSVGDLAVNEFSKTYFQGGGHKNAAGGRFDGTADEAARRFEELLPAYIEEIKMAYAH